MGTDYLALWEIYFLNEFFPKPRGDPEETKIEYLSKKIALTPQHFPSQFHFINLRFEVAKNTKHSFNHQV